MDRRETPRTDETGSALAEMAITLPVILILTFWSIFFADVGFVRLKMLEATRYAAWETTAMRSPDEIAADVDQRFKNLRSTDTVDQDPQGLLGLTEVRLSAEVQDDLDVNMLGRADFGSAKSDGGGFLDAVDSGLDYIIDYVDLNTKGKAQATVTLSVKNSIVPSPLEILNTRIGDEEGSQRMTEDFTWTKDQFLVFDTWKAWPNPYSKVSTDRETSVYRTYPVAEKMVSDQVAKIAFFGLTDNVVGDVLQQAMNFLDLPWFLSTDSFQDTGEGPVAMLPAARIQESWVPGYGQKPYRVGDKTFNGYNYSGNGFFNPVAGIDRARPTLPYKVSSPIWKKRKGSANGFQTQAAGGYRHTNMQRTETENEYFESYQCRGHYYEGMIDPSGKIDDTDSYDGCQGAIDDLLGRLGF